MPKTKAYDLHAKEYDDWYELYKNVYQSEIEAIKPFIPEKGKGLDIGTGTGRFAIPFNIKFGLEPSSAMRNIAEKRGIQVVDGVAEKLPFEDMSFDFATMITVTCFLDDVQQSFHEAYRIIKTGGSFIIAHIEKNSHLGKTYCKSNKGDPFLEEMTLFSTEEILSFLEKAGFHDFKIHQTLFKEYEGSSMVQPIKEGYNDGAFVVIKGKK